MKRNLLARDLMTTPVYRLTLRAPVRDAAVFLLEHGISAAPVEDEHGRWKGVLTMTDILRAVAYGKEGPAVERSLEAREPVAGPLIPALEGLDALQVGDLMTPGKVSVSPDAVLVDVVHAMVVFKVDRVFVIDERTAKLRGVITLMDALRSFDNTPASPSPEELRRLA